VAVVQISKIQHRRGKETITGLPQLASAELGWAVDTQKLYIGNGSVSEGAPAVGNTEILTEKTNIFQLLDQYQFQGNTDATVQTGEFSNDPVKRNIQQRLDDIVSIKSFGVVGDGVTDDTSALQRAVDQIFLNSGDKFNANSRRALKLEAGSYKVTNTIHIPPYANIIGDGPDKTIITMHVDPNELSQTAKPVFQTVGGDSTPGSYVEFASMQNLSRPQNIMIQGVTLTVDSAVTADAPLMYLDNTTESIIDNVKFTGTWNALDGLDAAQCGIELRGLGALTSENVLISNCQFTQLSIGVYSIFDTQTITIKDSLFTFGHVGVDLGRTSSGSGSQSQGPRHYLITNSKFDKIDDFGIAVHAPNNTTPFGHTSASNIFVDVANNGNGQNSPQTSVIKFDSELCQSIGDFFERDAFVNENSLSAVPFKPTVDGLHHTQTRMKTATLAEVDAPTQIIKLPFTKDKIAYIDYLVVKDGTSSDTTRQGRITLSVRDDSNINLTDSYSHTGNSDGAVEWTANLDDMDSTAGSETLLIKYRNPIGNGAGTLSYTISYFA
tara:strand:+ start:3305 stop:4960 length:1656 start_codon:yes stop_codon:yes gene_type:complete